MSVWSVFPILENFTIYLEKEKMEDFTINGIFYLRLSVGVPVLENFSISLTIPWK